MANDKPCQSAEEFLTRLRRSHKDWCEGGFKVPWVFRGQERADWPLLPSAHRKETRSRFFTDLYMEAKRSLTKRRDRDQFIINEVRSTLGAGPDQKVSRDQMRNAREALCVLAAERAGVAHFLALVNHLGFVVPGGDVPNRSFWGFQQDDGHAGMALAQHHGWPTRLLDWTFNPIVAAFFAADGAKRKEDGYFGVIAMRTDYPRNGWKPLTVPHSDVNYLHCQQGFFLYKEGAHYHFLDKGCWPTLDKDVGRVALRKVTLHNEHAPDVLQMLWREGVSLANLMPSHDNITATIKEHWRRIRTGFFDVSSS